MRAAQFGERLALAEHYADLLSTTGIEHGLIGPREADRLWERHLLNCSVVQEHVPAQAVVVDVGSGAGLPGIVLAIARPDVQMHLVEPLARRVTWLHATIAQLALANVTVHHGRAEAFAGTLRADVVTARAVAPLHRLGAWCAPLIRSGGDLLAMKGSSAADEVRVHRAALAKLGLTHVEVLVCGAEILAQPTTVVRARKGA